MLSKIIKNKILLFILLVIGLSIATTFGRFVYLEIKKHYFTSKNFYFESDKLKAVKPNYQVNNYNGVDQYNIAINVNSFKNNLLKSDSDIEYDITYLCSLNANCSVSKSSGTIYSANNTDDFVAAIAPNVTLYDQDVIWIDIVATSKSPYTKTLSARFTLRVGYFGLSHVITDAAHEPYFEVKVTNTLDYYNILEAFGTYTVGDKIDIDTYLALSDVNKAKCASAQVEMNFDPNLVLIDNTSGVFLKSYSRTTTNIGGHAYVNSFYFKIDATSSEIVRFYKRNASLDYTYPITNPTSIVEVEYH